MSARATGLLVPAGVPTILPLSRLNPRLVRTAEAPDEVSMKIMPPPSCTVPNSLLISASPPVTGQVTVSRWPLNVEVPGVTGLTRMPDLNVGSRKVFQNVTVADPPVSTVSASAGAALPAVRAITAAVTVPAARVASREPRLKSACICGMLLRMRVLP